MSESEFKKSTDKSEKIKLESALIYASWRQGSAFTGCRAGFEIGTVFVGNGAKIEIEGKSEKGKKLGKVKDTISSNSYSGEFDIPDDLEPGDEIYFKVKLSANSVEGESGRIPVYPGPVITNMSWNAEEARSGDVLRLSADVEKVEPGTEVLVRIFEYDEDGAHDKIAEIPAEVKDMKVDLEWEYEYHEDTDEIPSQAEMERYGGSYNPPEYFFTIKIGEFEHGLGQESGILTFKDYLNLKLVDDEGQGIPDVEYEITMPDGTTRTGNLDERGEARLEEIPPGTVQIVYKGIAPEVETVQADDVEPNDDGSQVSEEESEEDDEVSGEGSGGSGEEYSQVESQEESEEDTEPEEEEESGTQREDSDEDATQYEEIELDEENQPASGRASHSQSDGSGHTPDSGGGGPGQIDEEEPLQG